MSADTREYDAFGPWVDEVRDPEDVPRLYRDHPLDLAAAHLVLKVPRNIARRDATPATDLYDHLVAVEPTGLTVLSRRGPGGAADPAPGPVGYGVRRIAWEDLVAVRDEVAFLDGRVRVLARDGRVVEVAYNGSAAENLRRLVDELRVRSAGHGTAGAGGATGDGAGDAAGDAAGEERRRLPLLAPDALGRADVAVVTAYRDVARHRPRLEVQAWHRRTVLAPHAEDPLGPLRALAHAVSPMTLHAAVVATDGAVLEVFGRRDDLARGRRPVHSRARLVVPLRSVDAVTSRPHPRYAGAVTVTVEAGAARVSLVVPTGSETERVLRALPTR